MLFIQTEKRVWISQQLDIYSKIWHRENHFLAEYHGSVSRAN